MCETCTPAVRALMNSSAAISRLVCPRATCSSTSSSRGVRPSSRASSGTSHARPGRRLVGGLEVEARAAGQCLDLARAAGARRAARPPPAPPAARPPRPRGPRARPSPPRPSASARRRPARGRSRVSQAARGRRPRGGIRVALRPQDLSLDRQRHRRALSARRPLAIARARRAAARAAAASRPARARSALSASARAPSSADRVKTWMSTVVASSQALSAARAASSGRPSQSRARPRARAVSARSSGVAVGPRSSSTRAQGLLAALEVAARGGQHALLVQRGGEGGVGRALG